MPSLGQAYRAVKGWFWPEQQIKSRLVCLDILRGVAILLVLGAHMPKQGLEPGVPLGGVLRLWHGFGGSGVDLFFVLSGFLVGGLLLAEIKRMGQADAKRFLIRRGFKIWPTYYVYLLCLPLLQIWGGQTRFLDAALWSLRANLLHLQNYWRSGPSFLPIPNYITPRPHTWSLAVEEHFYLALAIVLALAAVGGKGERRLRALPAVVVGLCVGCTTARYILGRLHPDADIFYLLFPTHLRLDGLCFGVGLAYLYHFHAERFWAAYRWWPAMVLGGLALAYAPGPAGPPATTVWWTFLKMYVGFGLVLVGLLHGYERSRVVHRLLNLRPARVVAYIGFYSYSIYVWHTDLPGLVMRPVLAQSLFTAWGPGRWYGPLAVYAILALATGVVLGRVIETPALALRDRLFPRKAAPVTEPVTAEVPAPEHRRDTGATGE